MGEEGGALTITETVESRHGAKLPVWLARQSRGVTEMGAARGCGWTWAKLGTSDGLL